MLVEGRFARSNFVHKVASFHHFHDNVVVSSVLQELKSSHYVWMRDFLHDLELVPVELELAVRVEACLGDLLDRTRRLRAPVKAREDSAKAALAEFCHQLIVIAEVFDMLEFHLLFEA